MISNREMIVRRIVNKVMNDTLAKLARSLRDQLDEEGCGAVFGYYNYLLESDREKTNP